MTAAASDGVRRRALLAAAAGLGAAATGACGSTGAPTPSGSPSGPPSVVPSATPAVTTSARLPAEVVHGPRDVAAVALTFHGQGDPVLVGRLLDGLAATGTRVTVLAVGVWVQQQPGLVRRILADGHELGNHTQHHLDITALPAAKAFAEIDDCAAALRTAGGTIGRWFRPSQAQHSTPAIRAQAARAGYPTSLSYDVDSLDYTDPGAAAVVRNTLGRVQNGSIVSLHFGHAGTVAAIAEIVAGLHRRGLRPVTASELVG
jgi:peptidoglycan/xylan/chitin deacetylase (PgdA/CDA1 family)